MAIDRISVRGARQHNLKNINVDIPRDRFNVITGISGSGKSSLAFGTLYAEAQRRYLESVSPYARRLFHQMPVPLVDEMLGPILVSLHNVAFYLRLMADARGAVGDGRFAAFRAGCLARWGAAT